MTEPAPSARQLALFENELLRDKLCDTLSPGFAATFDPDEAERAGALEEHALALEAATESTCDLLALQEALSP